MDHQGTSTHMYTHVHTLTYIHTHTQTHIHTYVYTPIGKKCEAFSSISEFTVYISSRNDNLKLGSHEYFFFINFIKSIIVCIIIVEAHSLLLLHMKESPQGPHHSAIFDEVIVAWCFLKQKIM